MESQIKVTTSIGTHLASAASLQDQHRETYHPDRYGTRSRLERTCSDQDPAFEVRA